MERASRRHGTGVPFRVPIQGAARLAAADGLRRREIGDLAPDIRAGGGRVVVVEGRPEPESQREARSKATEPRPHRRQLPWPFYDLAKDDGYDGFGGRRG